jgi:hypothetical protein
MTRVITRDKDDEHELYELSGLKPDERELYPPLSSPRAVTDTGDHRKEKKPHTDEEQIGGNTLQNRQVDTGAKQHQDKPDTGSESLTLKEKEGVPEFLLSEHPGGRVDHDDAEKHEGYRGHYQRGINDERRSEFTPGLRDSEGSGKAHKDPLNGGLKP